jgi:hypothetical protein
LRVRSVLRANVLATVLLGLVAGVAGGVALTAWEAARRTASTMTRYSAYYDAPDLSIVLCPPDVTWQQAQADENILTLRCFPYQQTDEDLAQVLAVPGVARAGRFALVFAEMEGPRLPPTFLQVTVPRDGAAGTMGGRPILVDGRLADDDAAGEVVVNEEFRTRTGLGTGDTITLRPYAADQRDPLGIDDGPPPRGRPSTVSVVGVVRTPTDLEVQADTRSATTDEGALYVTPAWARATGGDVAGYTAILAWADEGRAAGIAAAMTDALAGRPNGVTEQPFRLGNVGQAVRYEGRAALVVALLAAIAAIAFVGQAVTRQSSRESTGQDALTALGFRRRQAIASALLRGAVTGAVAMIVAVGLAVAASPLGPVGVAHRAEIHPGIHVDAFVLVVGGLVVVATVTLVSAIPALRRPRRRNAAPSVGAAARTASNAGLPAPVVVGATMVGPDPARRGGLSLGGAIAGTAVAAACVVAAVGIADSYHAVVAVPERYGVPWDIAAGGTVSAADEAGLFERVRSIEQVTAASSLLTFDATVASYPTTLVSFEPVPGVAAPVRPVVAAGRLPDGPDEVALGATTMARAGVRIGDDVTIALAGSALPATPSRVHVVGQVMLNNAAELEPGDGAYIDAAWMRAHASPLTIDLVLMTVDPDAHDAGLAAVTARFPTTATPPIPSAGLRNLGRIDGVPRLLALLVAWLALAAFGGALFSTVRRRRSELAVLRTLGFTRVQVSAAVAAQATLLALVSLAIGLPLGLVIENWGWRLVAQSLGLTPHPQLSVPLLAGVSLAVLLLANLLSLVPGRLAGRVRPASALHAE